MGLSVISADNHIVEHRDAFTTRMPASLRDRAPRVARASDGGDGWSWIGGPVERSFGIEAVAGQGGQGKGFKPSGPRWEEILPGNYDGAAHLRDQETDGIDAAVGLAGLCMLPIDDGMDLALQELERCLAKGAQGLFIAGLPRRPYYERYYDPVFEAAAEAGVTQGYEADAKHKLLAGNATRIFSLG